MQQQTSLKASKPNHYSQEEIKEQQLESYSFTVTSGLT